MNETKQELNNTQKIEVQLKKASVTDEVKEDKLADHFKEVRLLFVV